MKILKVLSALPTQDGVGVKISRVAEFSGRFIDPFLMLDELKSDNKDDFMGGFPAHPHRGIETFTYLIKGGFEHRDQLGNRKAINAGDVQWMSTGKGVIHSEMPIASEQGLHGFQIWLNMAAKDKMNPPRYQDSSGSGLPLITHEKVQLKALAGSWQLGGERVDSPLNALANQGAIADIRIAQGGHLKLDGFEQDTAALYIYQGTLASTDNGTQYTQGSLLVLDAKAGVDINAHSDVGILVLRGNALREPIAHMGPFVMNTQEELHQAVRDYQQGHFGRIEMEV